jgi:hypothetical protein
MPAGYVEQRFISVVHQAQRSVVPWENTMLFKNLAMASAGLAFIAAPVAASAAPANPASTLSVAKSARAGSATSKKSKLGAGGVGIVPLVIGAGIIAGATYLIIDHEDDDSDSN